jgi:hypothetical protein
VDETSALGADAAQRLRAVVLLCGGVGSNAFRDAIGASILDLPVDRSGRTLIEHWHVKIAELAAHLGRNIDVLVVTDQNSFMPTQPSVNGRVAFTLSRDPKDYRGTGGVLRDICGQFGHDDLILVANGTQLMVESLPLMFEALSQCRSDVSLVAHSDGTPSGLMMMRCGVLRLIPEQGFVDLKEQALVQIAKEYRVRVVERDAPIGLPIRSLSDYIYALRVHHNQLENQSAAPNAFDENLSSTFSIVHPTAQVDSSAVVHDSVVLPGARVMPGAMLVRTVVGPNAIVPRDRRLVDHVQPAVGVARGRGEP